MVTEPTPEMRERWEDFHLFCGLDCSAKQMRDYIADLEAEREDLILLLRAASDMALYRPDEKMLDYLGPDIAAKVRVFWSVFDHIQEATSG